MWDIVRLIYVWQFWPVSSGVISEIDEEDPIRSKADPGKPIFLRVTGWQVMEIRGSTINMLSDERH